MKIFLFAIITCLMVSSCATTTTKKMTGDDRKIITPIEEKYMACLGEKTAMYIKGTDDVQLLLQHTASLCEPVLKELNSKLQKLGFHPIYSKSYVNAVRKLGK